MLVILNNVLKLIIKIYIFVKVKQDLDHEEINISMTNFLYNLVILA